MFPAAQRKDQPMLCMRPWERFPKRETVGKLGECYVPRDESKPAPHHIGRLGDVWLPTNWRIWEAWNLLERIMCVHVCVCLSVVSMSLQHYDNVSSASLLWSHGMGALSVCSFTRLELWTKGLHTHITVVDPALGSARQGWNRTISSKELCVGVLRQGSIM